MKKIIKYSLANALATALYIILVAFFIFSLNSPGQPDEKTLLIPIAMLMLLVFSVALIGTLIFSRPIVWYLDGKKKSKFYSELKKCECIVKNAKTLENKMKGWKRGMSTRVSDLIALFVEETLTFT